MSGEEKMNNQKVWFVTGASKGLGLTLTINLLNKGYKVAATSRSLTALTKAVSNQSDNFLPLEVDLLDEQSVQKAVEQALKIFGSIDFVVNNAGYGQLGTIEETSDREARQNYDVNVFGTLNVIRAVMPHLRAKRAGHIFNISSIGGFIGNFSGWGIYCSTKFAVAGLTESLHADAKPFGINVTLVYPGYFRTNFLDKDSMALPANPIADYEEARRSQDFHVNGMNGQQQGDPEKAAEALVKVASAAEPPLHLFLGTDAYEVANAKIAALQKDLSAWQEVTLSTNLEQQTV
jgi:NAD(P)-dependent dehydrogenase (short-subunit alcohol dehydrogenase family)